MNNTRKVTTTTTREYDEDGRLVAEKVETVTEEQTTHYEWTWTVPLPIYTPPSYISVATGSSAGGGTFTSAVN